MNARRDLQKIVETISGAESFLLAAHVFPDGDALGSMFALGDILESLGKRVVIYGEDEVNYLYRFLPGCERVSTELPDLDDIDCVIALDCGDRYRLGRAMDELLGVHPFIVLDHHCGHKNFGDLRWVDHQMPSTGNLVYELAKALKAPLSYEAAYCLYTAIVSDTGSFKYSSTTADTFKVAGELVALGVNPEDVAGNLFDNYTANRLRLLQMVLESLELLCDDRVAFIRATREMFLESATAPCDTETFINFPRSLSTVKVAVFLKETDNVVSVSMRSKECDYDVAQVARHFGGGGHRNAAGFKVADSPSLERVKGDLLKVLEPLVA